MALGTMAAGLPARQHTWRIAWRLMGYLRPYFRGESIAVVATAAISANMLIRPWLLRVLVDDVFGGGDRALLAPTLAGLAGLGLAMGLSAVIAHVFYARAAEGAMFGLREDVLRHAYCLSLPRLRRRRTGDVVAHLTADATEVSKAYELMFSLGAGPVIRLPGYLIILFAMDWRLGLIAAASLPLRALLPTLLQGRTQAASQRIQDTMGSLSALLTELVGGARDVKAFNREDWAGGRLREAARRLWRSRLRLVLLQSVDALSHVAFWGSIVAIWAVLARPVVEDQITLGFLIAAAQYMRQIDTPLERFVSMYVDLQVALGAARRVFAFLDTPEESALDGGETAAVITRGSVCFERVSFSYVAGDPVLRAVSFCAAPGETVALVGPSGAGKTTLVNLLLGFLHPVSGRITVDGRDISSLHFPSLRYQTGVVFQDPVLFEGTIAENVRLGRDHLPAERITKAAIIANAHDFITATEHGYDTWIGERGLRLSGGQAQRVAIARAIANDPRILILDEASSALDAESERLTQEALARASKGRTTVVVAHRLATVRNADRIVVLDEGKVLDIGRHEELYGRCELYRRLCDLQFLQPESATA